MLSPQMKTIILLVTTGLACLVFVLSLSTTPAPTPATVINPATNRAIKVHGPTFCALLQAGFVYHDEKLHPICPGKYAQPILSKAWSTVEPVFSKKGQEKSDSNDDNGDDDDLMSTSDDKAGILFVNKPSGLLTVPGREQPDCLIHRVMEQYPQAKVCHRLDRDTSGVMILALDPHVHRHVSKQFETRQTSKIYTALVSGHVEQDEGVVDLPIGKETTTMGYNRWVIGGTKPRAATTGYVVEQRLQTRDGFCYTRVRVQPLTGRGQQIRLHMQAAGHALLGDTLHADNDVSTAAPRLLLHATQVGLTLSDGTTYVQATVPPPF